MTFGMSTLRAAGGRPPPGRGADGALPAFPGGTIIRGFPHPTQVR